MTVEWCPSCRRTIPQPPFRQTTAYAKFVRDHRCYICDSMLRSAGESPRSANSTGGGTSSPQAEPHSRSPAHDSPGKVEMDRLRFQYETRKGEVDRLRFEYEKHQRSIQALQTKNARLSRECQDMRDLDREWMKSDDYRGNAMDRAYRIQDEITRNEGEISTAEREMKWIQRDLDKAERAMREIHQAIEKWER